MKDLLLVAINARYSHTNLATRYLRQALSPLEVQFLEVSINDSLNRILSHLLASETFVYGFSSYIWNIEMILKITELLKKSRPQAVILLGGPEVSFDSEKILEKHAFIDCIVTGNGELKLPQVMENLKASSLTRIAGVYFSKQLKERFPMSSHDQDIERKKWIEPLMRDFSSPYEIDELSDLKNRIIYYETMRGCPYRCSYCLSSLDTKVVFKPLDIVFSEIDLFFKMALKQVKLVDRTFNCRPDRAIQIFEYIISQANKHGQGGRLPNFHFEMTGDQISADMISCLSKAPKGLIQFEIGIQTTCEKTLKAIDRPINFEKSKKAVHKLLKMKNIHIHLDLIAGLPYESFDIFENSFNEVIALEPDMLQLGFLKGLKGTKIRNESLKHNYIFADFPPYEIVRNAYLTAEELYLLRDIETLLDRYYNSGFFMMTIKSLFFSAEGLKPFRFLNDLAKWWGEKGYFDKGIAKENLSAILYYYLKEENLLTPMLLDCLIYDHFFHNQLKEPEFCQVDALAKEAVFEFLKDQVNHPLYLAEFKNWPSKKIYSQIKIIKLSRAFYQSFFPEELIESQKNDGREIFILLTKQGKSQLIYI